MNVFGIGGLEFLLLGAVALFVLGPKRMLEGIREGRRIYADLKRQRDQLQSMIAEAIDLEEIKKQIDSEGILKEAKSLKEELALDQVAEDVKDAANIDTGSVSRNRQLSRPPVSGDDEIRAKIPDLKLTGMADHESAGSPADEPDTDEVKS